MEDTQRGTQPNAGAALDTYFAPAERAGIEELRAAIEFATDNPMLKAIQSSIGGYLMILNAQRQILAVNEQLAKLLDLDNPQRYLGQRPGEALGCVHSDEGPGGCGTSQACSTCGSILSILASQEHKTPADRECLVSVQKNGHTEAMDLRIRATPVTVGEREYTVLVFFDISGEKRRQALERVFFHDILNTVGGLLGYSTLLGHIDDMDPKQVAERIVVLSKKLNQEIQDQRNLTRAEDGSLEVASQQVRIGAILEEIRATFEAHEAASGRKLAVEGLESRDQIEADEALVGRILTNMVKNALEASERNDTVRVWHVKDQQTICFYVHNPGKMSDEVALQVFKRSFTTKTEKGHGLGTYSMKLFAENYLKGEVDFETGEQGTTFWLKLPVQFSRASA